MQILNTMLNVMTSAADIETSREDLVLVQRVESKKKAEIEKSRLYVGYKLFWIMRAFLEGRSFPYGFLPAEKHRVHVYDVLNFVTNDYVLDQLLQFDSNCFFRVVARLFWGAPLRFLQEQRTFLEERPVKGTALSPPPSTVVNELFPRKCENHARRQEHFFRFLIQVQAQHDQARTE